MKPATVNATADVNHEDVKTIDRIMSHVETPAQRELFGLLRTLITVRAMNKARGVNANPA